MERQNQNVHWINAALFVDFDNIFISLAEQDSHVANQFATNPNMWLTWLEQHMLCEYLHAEEERRRILIRRCYLNPQAFSAFRPYFIRSAFEVIDCPPLTTRGKTSTDIHMVMDILDALNHVTFFDEFIILSGDADFTPVMSKLRKHARYSTVLSAGYVSPAYKSSCDHFISQDVFIRDALGITDQEEELGIHVRRREISATTADLLKKMATRLYAVAVVPGGIEASDLPGVYKEFDEFRQGNHWLGFYSLRRLTQAIVDQREGLVIIEEDPWRVARSSHREGTAQAPSRLKEEQEVATETTRQEIKTAISEWIKSTVGASQSAVTMAALAQATIQRFGAQVSNTDWMGAGTFKHLLTELDLGGLEISSVVPGFVYDPTRHELPSTAQAGGDIRSLSRSLDSFSLRYPDLAPLAQKIHQLTDTPYLIPEHYALLLRELAREINERGYQLTRTSKTVRDRCVERGAPIARSHVSFVLIGISYTGYRFGKDLPENPARLGEALVQNTINLCQTAQFNLSDEEVSQVRDWITGALEQILDRQ